MAEKPKLKKSDEILGSIVAEPARGARRGGDRRQSAKDEPESTLKMPDIKTADDEDEDALDLSEQPVILPSAQTLAEKLLSREDKRRQLNFAKYELPKRVEASTPPEDTTPPSAPVREASFSPAPRETAAPNAPVREASFNPAPRETSAPNAPVREASFSPAPRETAAPNAPASVTFETKPSPAPNVSFDAPSVAITGNAAPSARGPRVFSAPSAQERAAVPTQTFEAPSAATFGASNDVGAGIAPREFEVPGSSSASRSPRERSRRRQPKPDTPAEDEPRHIEEAQSFEPVPAPRPAPAPAPAPRIIPFIETEFEPEPVTEPKAQLKPEPKAKTVPKPEPKSAIMPEPKPEPEVSEREKSRREFLKRLESQFTTQFEEKFEDGTLKEREAIRRAAEAARPAAEEARPYSEPEEQKRPRLEVPTPKNKRPEADSIFGDDAHTEESFFGAARLRQPDNPPEPEPNDSGLFDAPPQTRNAESPALDFISKFEREIQEEEEVKAQDFQETIAEKFERERERYLKELDVKLPESREDEPPSTPARKKLDFQIQPEMHMSGDTPPQDDKKPKPERPAPVTYTRGAVVTPQTPVETDAGIMPPPGVKPPAGKKTSEQLLLEHGQRARVTPKPAAPKPETLNFKFSTPEEQEKEKKREGKKVPILPAEKWPRRIFLISAVMGLFALGLLLFPIIRYIQLLDRVDPAAFNPGAASALTEDTLSIYENRTFTQTAKLKNAVFKSSGLTLTNAEVSEYVLIEGIESSGKIRLEDVSVGSAVSLMSGGVNTLELHNVKAERVIINNANTNVTITASGNTDVGVVELRTPSNIRQSDISNNAPGIRGVIVTAPEAGGAMNAKLDGLNLRTLETQASESVLVFENGTRAESMSSDGSLSLSGSGRVTSLSIGARTGQGAGADSDRKDVSLLVSGVTVTNINVKGPAVLNLASSVDNISTSYPATVGGSGSVATLTINPPQSQTRLTIEIAGLTVQNIYANTVSRVNVTGSARVNTLTADASVYLLGNKVNQLTVNADGTAYENEPDNIDVAIGIKPPLSKAENPGLDLSAADTPANSEVVSAIGDEFSTTCGHSRESGGFVLGNGGLATPYEVATPLQLAHVAVHPESYFLQSADIDIATESKFSGGFPMIASLTEPFAGVYNGGGFAIANLRITSQSDSVGLFAANKGIIENVRVISGALAATSAQVAEVGGIAGANMAGGQIRSCSNGATVTGGALTSAGGIAGYNRGKVHDCYNYSKITGEYQTGGLVGLLDGAGSLTGSYNAGTVEGDETDTGAVAGKNDGATIANCYFLEGVADVGIGSGNGVVTEKTSEYLASTQMTAELAAGNDASLWVLPETPVNGYRYPVHKKP